MGAVPLLVPYTQGESQTSFMSRLAARNGFTLCQLARDMNMSPRHVADGTGTALTDLARLGHADEAALRDASITKGERGFVLRGEQLSLTTMRRRRNFVCARCLVEDAGAATESDWRMAGRTGWLLTQIRTCLKHGIGLTATPDPVKYEDDVWDFTLRIRPMIGELHRIANTETSQKPSRLERYLFGRLDGERHGCWLDGLPFHAAAETCDWLGAVALYGAEASPLHLSIDECRQAGDAGFEVASDGEAGFAAFSDGMRRRVDPSQANVDGQKVFKTFWKFLMEHKEIEGFEPVRKVMADLLTSARPVPVGSTILGVPVVARKVHSIRTGAIEAGLHHKTFRAVLEREGIISKEERGSLDSVVTVEPDRIAAIMHRLHHSLSYTEAMDYLNVPRHPAWEIYKAGIVNPHTRMDEGSHNRTFYLEFSKEDLDDFLNALFDGSECVDAARPGEVGIQRAAIQNCCSNAEVVRLILTKRLEWVGRLRNERGFMSVLVRKDEVAPLVRGADPDGITEGRVRHRLRAHDKSVPVLINDGLLVVIMAPHPRTRALQRFVTLESLERFEASYVTMSMRAVELGCSRTLVWHRLRQAKIEPALHANRYHSAFYKRSELPDRF